MITTQENDWSPQLKGIPWIQKARPGLRPTRDAKGVLPGTSRQLASADSPDPIPLWLAMPTDVRKHRLMREAHATEDLDVASTENDIVMIVIAVLMLLIYWGAAAIAVGSVANRQEAAMEHQPAMLKKEVQVSTPIRSANSKDSDSR